MISPQTIMSILSVVQQVLGQKSPEGAGGGAVGRGGYGMDTPEFAPQTATTVPEATVPTGMPTAPAAPGMADNSMATLLSSILASQTQGVGGQPQPTVPVAPAGQPATPPMVPGGGSNNTPELILMTLGNILSKSMPQGSLPGAIGSVSSDLMRNKLYSQMASTMNQWQPPTAPSGGTKFPFVSGL